MLSSSAAVPGAAARRHARSCWYADEASAAVTRLHPQGAAEVRRRSLSFGTCSIPEPVADLVQLRLLTLEAAS